MSNLRVLALVAAVSVVINLTGHDGFHFVAWVALAFALDRGTNTGAAA